MTEPMSHPEQTPGEHHDAEASERSRPPEAASSGPEADRAPAGAVDEERGAAGAAEEAATEEAAGEAEAAEVGDAAEAEEAEDSLAAAQAERDEYLELLRRERAEFENFRKRANKEQREALDRGAEQLCSELLLVLDNFGYTLQAAEHSSDDQLTKGVEMVHRQLVDALEQFGLQPVPGEGATFDPTIHEAVAQVEAEEELGQPVEEPVVAEVLRPGYRFKDRLLRPASVKVAK